MPTGLGTGLSRVEPESRPGGPSDAADHGRHSGARRRPRPGKTPGLFGPARNKGPDNGTGCRAVGIGARPQSPFSPPADRDNDDAVGGHSLRVRFRKRATVQRHDKSGLRDNPNGLASGSETPRNSNNARKSNATPTVPRAVRLRRRTELPGGKGNPRRRSGGRWCVRPINAAGARHRNSVANSGGGPHRLHTVADGHERPEQRGVKDATPAGSGRGPGSGWGGTGGGPAAGSAGPQKPRLTPTRGGGRRGNSDEGADRPADIGSGGPHSTNVTNGRTW